MQDRLGCVSDRKHIHLYILLNPFVRVKIAVQRGNRDRQATDGEPHVNQARARRSPNEKTC
jgi:hypothetical protein